MASTHKQTNNPGDVRSSPTHWFFQIPSSISTLLHGRTVLFMFASLAVLFGLLTFMVVGVDLKPTWWDIQVTRDIQEIPSVPLGIILTAVSWPGFTPWNWIIASLFVLFLVWRRLFTEAVFMAVASAGGLLAEVVKIFIDRPRPNPDLVHVITVLHSYSFPSGHVTGYVSMFGFVFYLLYSLRSPGSPLSPIRVAALVVLGAAILLVGPSRVYMGQHWASDTLAGYALGFTWLMGTIELHRWWLRKHPKAAHTEAVTKPGSAAPDAPGGNR